MAEAIDRAFLSAADLKGAGLVSGCASRPVLGRRAGRPWRRTLKLVTNYGREAFNIDMQNPFGLLKLLMEILTPPKEQMTSTPKLALIYAHGLIRSGKSRQSPFGKGGLMGSENTCRP